MATPKFRVKPAPPRVSKTLPSSSSTSTADTTSKTSKRGRKKKRQLIHDDFDDDDDDGGGHDKTDSLNASSSKTEISTAASAVATVRETAPSLELAAAPATIGKTSSTVTTTATTAASVAKAHVTMTSSSPAPDLRKSEDVSVPPPKPFRPNHIPAQLVSASAMATAKPTKFHRSLAFKDFKHRSENLKSGECLSFHLF